MLKKAVIKLSKRNRALEGKFFNVDKKIKKIIKLVFILIIDCGTCYDDILAAVTDCFTSFDDWKTCVEDILGAGNPCIDCVCEVIVDIGNIFGQDWHC